jgi:hypothetical protein
MWHRDRQGRPLKHKVWPYNPKLVYCPKDGQYHTFGCPCVRKHIRLLPTGLHAYYRGAWQREKDVEAGLQVNPYRE